MIIKQVFKKDINRNIETVIKADDREHISDEVAEYVVTDEIGKKIRDFFQAYNDYGGANGVWISGFFGSGKSHLLKILSYVLENKKFDGYHSGDLFAEKIESDEMLKGDASVPTGQDLYYVRQLYFFFYFGHGIHRQKVAVPTYLPRRNASARGVHLLQSFRFLKQHGQAHQG